MEEQLKIALVQSDLVWEAPDQNRMRFTDKIGQISDDVDVIVLPEMFTSGFTMSAKRVAEFMDGATVNWMRTMSKTHNAAIVASLVILEDNRYYNRLLFVEPSGKVSYYNKRHTFTLAGENEVYTAGLEKLIINYKGWRLCPLICYDLRFPVWSRNMENYDVLLYIANWPVPRIDAWNTLLKARAIENMCYTVGVNRIGIDGVNAEYNGSSGVFDVLGNKLTDIPLNKECTAEVVLVKKHIERYRNRLKFLEDKDDFSLK